MKRSFHHVLKRLALTPDKHVSVWDLPNGNGHCMDDMYASGVTMKAMREQGLVEFARGEGSRFPGYRITVAGLAALSEVKA